jgi:hypothetical protein
LSLIVTPREDVFLLSAARARKPHAHPEQVEHPAGAELHALLTVQVAPIGHCGAAQLPLGQLTSQRHESEQSTTPHELTSRHWTTQTPFGHATLPHAPPTEQVTLQAAASLQSMDPHAFTLLHPIVHVKSSGQSTVPHWPGLLQLMLQVIEDVSQPALHCGGHEAITQNPS